MSGANTLASHRETVPAGSKEYNLHEERQKSKLLAGLMKYYADQSHLSLRAMSNRLLYEHAK